MPEESPSTTRIKCLLTTGQGNLTASATEKIPPNLGKGEKVR